MRNPTGGKKKKGKAMIGEKVSEMIDTVPLSNNRVHFRTIDMNRK